MAQEMLDFCHIPECILFNLRYANLGCRFGINLQGCSVRDASYEIDVRRQ